MTRCIGERTNRSKVLALLAFLLITILAGHTSGCSIAVTGQERVGHAVDQSRDSVSKPYAAAVRGRSQITRDASPVDDLRTPNGVVPGGRYINVVTKKDCSSGWIMKSNNGSRVMFTAGHCGKVGDRVSVTTASGLELYGGEFIDEMLTSGQADIAMIRLAPGVRSEDTPYGQGEIVGVATATWLQDNHPRMCRLGAQTGLSCGDFISVDPDMHTVYFENIVDHGDSGGPVFTQLDDGTIIAVGVAAAYQSDDATRTSATLIAPFLADKYTLAG